MDYFSTTLRAEIKLQPVSEIMSRSQRFNSPLNKQVLDVVWGEKTSLVSNIKRTQWRTLARNAH